LTQPTPHGGGEVCFLKNVVTIRIQRRKSRKIFAPALERRPMHDLQKRTPIITCVKDRQNPVHKKGMKKAGKTGSPPFSLRQYAP